MTHRVLSGGAALVLALSSACSQGSDTPATERPNPAAPPALSTVVTPNTTSIEPAPTAIAPPTSVTPSPVPSTVAPAPSTTTSPSVSPGVSPTTSPVTSTPAPTSDAPSSDVTAVDETSAPPAPGSDCTNGAKDGDEAGVDCGGGCSEPCVVYERAKPNPMNENRSGCEANGNGFMCPRAMVFSPEMKQAAFDDWGGAESPFVYGVVGHDPDPNGVDGASASYSSTCCQCYQLVFKGPTDGSVTMTLPKPLIVQAFNTYAGGPTAFDVYMAVGGHGNFNGCTANGGLYTGYPDTGGDWSGGARATRYSQCASAGVYSPQSVGAEACQSYVDDECNKIETAEAYVRTARDSCVETNRPETHYHMNWDVVVKRVECPVGLTRVTGCQLNEQGLPAADPAIQTAAQAMQNGFRDGYHTTTMEDCCRPTCAWPTNVSNTRDGWSRFYTCDGTGGVD